ncbi:MAG: hypothetical protein ACT6Q9_02165 [Polaromonas sp.]|uniref:hypothetical protein n=1 Tax=Polaromonas sp. TaxID=1869339 RepID=UPI004036581F
MHHLELIDSKVIIRDDVPVSATPLETVCPAPALFSSNGNQSAGSSLRTFFMGLLVLASGVADTLTGQQSGPHHREIL